jgi:hypothetical protein
VNSKTVFFGVAFLASALIFSPFSSSGISVSTTVAFTTLDAGGGYYVGGGTSIAGSAHGYQGYGNLFVPIVSGTLDSIGIALTSVNSPELVNVRLCLDSGNGFPTGATLASGSIMTAGYLGSTSTALSVFTPLTPVTLNPGTGYWLLVTPYSSTSWDVWNDETTDVIGEHAATSDGINWGIGPNQPLSAFQVIVVVPEPSCLALMLSGLVLIAGRRRIIRS